MADLGKAVLTALTAVMVCMFLTMTFPAMAQYACGLQSGKYAKYDWSVTESATGQSYSISGTLDINIQSISGSGYSGTSKVTVTGGSLPQDILNIPQNNQTFSGDVGSGYGSTGFNGLLAGLLAIPANMTAGSNIPNVGSVQQIGSWGGRSAVVVNSSGFNLGQGNAYYDQTTGIFLYSKTTLNYQNVYSFEYKLEMVGTDLWCGGFGGGLLGIDPWMWTVIMFKHDATTTDWTALNPAKKLTAYDVDATAIASWAVNLATGSYTFEAEFYGTNFLPSATSNELSVNVS